MSGPIKLIMRARPAGSDWVGDSGCRVGVFVHVEVGSAVFPVERHLRLRGAYDTPECTLSLIF